MATKLILLIDDDHDILTVTQLALELATGWEIITVTSGQQGITKAETDQPDAILLDVMMPGLSGFDTFERLQANPRVEHIPVIFLTAKTQIDYPKRFQKTKLAGVIAKPFDSLTLASQVATMLGWQT